MATPMTPATATAWREALEEDVIGGGLDARYMPCAGCDAEFVCDVGARDAEPYCDDCLATQDAAEANPDAGFPKHYCPDDC